MPVSLCAAFFGVLDADLFVFLIKIYQGLVAGVLVCCCVLCVGGRALGVSDQDYPRAGVRVCYCVLFVCGRGLGVPDQDHPSADVRVCIVYCMLVAEPLVYMSKIIQGLMCV